MAAFAQKFNDLRQSFEVTLETIADATGIGVAILQELETGSIPPTGDQVLILADYFRRDFAWLIQDEAEDPDANATRLFRTESQKLSQGDRHAIAEFIHLCKSQALLEELLEQKQQIARYSWPPPQGFKKPTHKQQGIDCAEAFRRWHKLPATENIADIYQLLRDSGLRVFRRALPPGSAISGLFINHPDAGRCILINFSEDIYRQRFSAAHEAGHALMDEGEPFNVSTESDSGNNWVEMRANSFASAFLMPGELLKQMWRPEQWRQPDRIIDAANRLSVTIPALLSALRRENLISEETRSELKDMWLRLPEKREPELGEQLSPRERERKQTLLATGLHTKYVDQGLEAHRRGLISLGKLAEMFLVDPQDVGELAALFGRTLQHG